MSRALSPVKSKTPTTDRLTASEKKAAKFGKVTLNSYKLFEIPTWPQYYADCVPFDDVIPRAEGFKINWEMNESVASKISLFRGDITLLEVDVVVNICTASFLNGDGGDALIQKAAGPALKVECRNLGGCLTGEAKLTGGYLLPAKYIIHTVAPQGESPAMVAKCFKAIFDLIKENNVTAIAIPTIAASSIADPKNHITVGLQKIREFMETQYSHNINRIILCSQTVEEENIYRKLLKSYFPLK